MFVPPQMFRNNYRAPQAHQPKSACNGNQNSEGGKTWGVNKVGLKFNDKHWNLYFIWMAGRRWSPPSSSQLFQTQTAINGRLAAASWNDNPYLVTCDELPLASTPSVSKDFSLRRCRKVNSLQQTYGPNNREAEFMTHRDIWVYKKRARPPGHHDTEVGAYIPTQPLDFLFSMFKFRNKADGGEPSSAYGWSYQNALDPHSLSTEVQINCVDICRFLLFIWNWSANRSFFFFFRQIQSPTNEPKPQDGRVLTSLWTK